MIELNKLRVQLIQESLQKNVTQERIIELTDKYQGEIAKLISQVNYLSSQVSQFNNRFTDEYRKRTAVENQLKSTTNELKTEIERMKIERDNLLGRLKDAQAKTGDLQGVQTTVTQKQVELAQLKAKLSQVEQEKSDVEGRAVKLENLLNEVGKGKGIQEPVRQVVVPQVITEPQAKAAVTIVQPLPAVGRMAPPLTTLPNVVSGIIKDSNGMLLTDVVIVVKDQVGNPVRALKSNKIGQFAISTPLPDGTFTMELEKEEHEFDIVQIKLEGKLMPPIEIRAR